jgi:DNA-binding transcriptional LysR family regulator
VEFRQLRFFVTLAEELHFGRAAAREHIVQSALSQQIRRLERELNVRLFNRDTHHVGLTPAGAAFLVDARQLLAHAERAAAAARRATAPPVLRAGVPDACCDSVPRLLRVVQERYPDLEIHQVEVGVPEQLRMLAEGKLDVGFGRASMAPPEISAELVRLDPLGVLVPAGHRFAPLAAVPIALLAGEALLLPAGGQAPEFTEFVTEVCQSAGFTPAWHRGTVGSVRAAAELARHGSCVPCVPASCASALPGVGWKPLTQPEAHYPWSVLWRAGDRAKPVTAAVSSARALARDLGWLGEASASAPRRLRVRGGRASLARRGRRGRRGPRPCLRPGSAGSGGRR